MLINLVNMKLYQIVLFFLFAVYGMQGFTQTLKGIVIDENNKPIVNVTLTDTINRTQTLTGKDGQFELEVSDKSIVKISHIGYTTVFLNKQQFSEPFQIFRLLPFNHQLKEVTVSGNRLKKVIDDESENILDYLVYSEFILVLKSYRGQKYISLNDQKKTFDSFLLPDINAKKLFEDCFGNVHILSKDSCYQIHIDTSLYIVDVNSIKRFNNYLKPCVAEFDSTLVFSSFTNHNKKYALTSVNKGSPDKKTFYVSWDKVAEKVAREDFSIILAAYYLETPEEENIVDLGIWSGDLIEVITNSSSNLPQVVWYKNISSKEINVSTLKSRDYLITFDFLNQDIHRFDHNGKEVNQIKLPDTPGKDKSIQYDRHQNKFYLQSRNKSTYHFFSIDPKTGEMTKVLHLYEEGFPEKVKIHNGWLYFLKSHSGFYKLYKVKLPENG